MAELSAALNARHEDTLQRVDACLQAGGLLEHVGSELSFPHPVLREVTYSLMPRTERCTFHLRIGTWFEQQTDTAHAQRLSELAHHFAEAALLGCAEKAVLYAQRAAALTLQATAYAQAVTLLERALHCAALLTDYSAHDKLALELAHAEAVRVASGESAAIKQQLITLAQRAEQLNAPTLYARAALAYAGNVHSRVAPTRFAALVDGTDVHLLRSALHRLGPEPNELRVRVLCALAYALVSSPAPEQYRPLIHQARDAARQLDNPALLARVLLYFSNFPVRRTGRVAGNFGRVRRNGGSYAASRAS